MNKKVNNMILGHNALFGVNHLSAEKGMVKEKQFSDTKTAIDVIESAFDSGVRGMMMSTHPRAELIIKDLQNNNRLTENLNFSVLLPYLQKYVTMANEKGAVNMIFDIIKRSSLKQQFGLLLSGGSFLAKRDLYQVLKAMIDVEMLMFSGVKKTAIFLHNILTDMIIGLNIPDMFEFYYDYINTKHDVIPGFCTLNFPRLMDILEKTQIENPLIMAPFNSLGFQMNPSLDENISYLNNKNCTFVAMSTLAAGQIMPKEAYKYLFETVKVDSVIAGSSSPKHIADTFSIVNSYFNK